MPRDPLPPWILDRHRAIGRRIQRERLQANLTQEGLRDLTGVSRDSIQRIEAGTADPRLSWLEQIARALGVPVTELLAEE